MSIELKIKSKHLAEEARIIKFEEKKLLKNYRKYNNTQDLTIVNLLHEHRIWDVRNEQRATYLARAFIAGKKYSDVERKCDKFKRGHYVTPRIKKMVEKYSDLTFNKDWYLT